MIYKYFTFVFILIMSTKYYYKGHSYWILEEVCKMDSINFEISTKYVKHRILRVSTKI